MEWSTEDIFLGRGGSNPGLDVLRGGHVESLLDLAVPHSVYALYLTPDGSALALGTKGGLVQWRRGPAKRDQQPAQPQPMNQGAPVLSVCVFDSSHLVTSDSVGRCLLWGENPSEPPRPLTVAGSPVCCLARLEADSLIGLSAAGQLLLWRFPEGRLEQTIAVPAPPPMIALVRLCSWQAAHALAWPSREGDLVLWDLSHHRARSLRAHCGEFYGLTTCGQDLLTVGKVDGLLKRWKAGVDSPVTTWRVSETVIAALAVPGRRETVLLVTQSGEAGLYTLDSSSDLRCDVPLPRRDYRSVHGLSVVDLEAMRRKREESEVRAICDEIRKRVAQRDVQGVEAGHRKLITLGYRQGSLILRGQEARSRQDFVGELKALHELAGLLPAGARGGHIAMLRYARLLSRAWLLELASQVNTPLGRSGELPAAVAKSARLAAMSRVIETQPHVIEAVLGLDVLIQAASVVKKPFQGRYQVTALDDVNCHPAKIRADDLLSKYRATREEMKLPGLPEGRRERVTWLSAQGGREVELVSFELERGYQLALKVSSDADNGVVRQVILFDCSSTTAGETTEAWNHRCQAALGEDPMLLQARLDAVLPTINLALRRLTTGAASRNVPFI